ncbi:DegT/DnrJ/EryC1/StrS family aminotransferase [Paenibacillus chungangensis]|uniref:DegT/DnrJ/EryC1/StrS family aminotransferase n=1 Tax=Paenibacillus chungangensis TaxID=696535 RepID=A0ABW3HLN7_9BACL
MRKIALHGGTPVMSSPVNANYPGALVMGAEEAESLVKIATARSPFRYYGIDMQHQVRRFEEDFAAYMDVRYALGVTSCTAALHVAMKALEIGYGDKVAVPAMTFLATAGAVVASNAVPVFVDVDDSIGMDPADLDRKLGADPEIRAVIIVHLLGYPCDLEGLIAVAKKHGVPVVEDVAQSCGSSYRGRRCGTFGDIGVYSFQMNKIITSGEGGALVTNDPRLFARAVRFHDQGIIRDKEYYGVSSPEEEDAFIGLNYRMSEFTGAVLVEQLAKLDDLIKNMREVHDILVHRISQQLPDLQLRRLFDADGAAGCSFAIQLSNETKAQAMIEGLNAENITAYLLYEGKPLFKRDIFQHRRSAEKHGFPYHYPFQQPLDYSDESCLKAIELSPRTVFMPIVPTLTKEDAEAMAKGIVSVYRTLLK